MSFFFSSDWPKALKPFSVAIVHAEFNPELVEKLLEQTVKGLRKCGIVETAIEVFAVPGALEIPFLGKKLLETEDFDGIIGLGIVLRGETLHFELVASEAVRGIMDLNLLGHIPVISGILAVENESQAVARLQKGLEFGKGLVQMMNFSVSFQNPDETEEKI